MSSLDRLEQRYAKLPTVAEIHQNSINLAIHEQLRIATEDLQDIDRALREVFGPAATAGVGSVHTLPHAVRRELAQAQARIAQLEAVAKSGKEMIEDRNIGVGGNCDAGLWSSLEEALRAAGYGV